MKIDLQKKWLESLFYIHLSVYRKKCHYKNCVLDEVRESNYNNHFWKIIQENQKAVQI